MTERQGIVFHYKFFFTSNLKFLYFFNSFNDTRERLRYLWQDTQNFEGKNDNNQSKNFC